VSRSVRLRPWQHAALARFTAAERPDFLAVATPGAGKTTFALTALRVALGERPRRIVVVAPTAHLKMQWAQAAAGMQLHLDPAWSPADGSLPRDMHGIVTTYQQVAIASAALRSLAHDALVILDEVHHGGEERAWGDALREAFSGAARRLCLSGTPFRSDTRAIPFVRYVADEAVPDFEYGYGDALRDGRVVRPIYFPAVGGRMEWASPDGEVYEASFEDPLIRSLANQRLRTALSLEGDWLPTVLHDAVERLNTIRRVQPNAGGLIIATDQEHARGIADLLTWRFKVSATLVTSDDPSASERIARFAVDSSEWLVAVRMVSEGVDIPRLRVGVYATTTTTDLFFRQAVGRLVRWVPGVPDQRAWLFIPDDQRLRAWAALMTQQRRHSLVRDSRRPGEEFVEGFARPEEASAEAEPVEQMSMFAPLSAVATETAPISPWQEPLLDDTGEGDLRIEVDLAEPPHVAAADGSAVVLATRRDQKDALRLANANAARDLARRTGMSHAQVNAELNRLSGIRRITEATVAQLDSRLKQADRWLARI
jgi:superfamily II DNA or RNA helicase